MVFRALDDDAGANLMPFQYQSPIDGHSIAGPFSRCGVACARMQTQASEDKHFLFSKKMTEGAALECIDHWLKDLASDDTPGFPSLLSASAGARISRALRYHFPIWWFATRTAPVHPNLYLRLYPSAETREQ
jgi:hypothetical protein